MVILYARMWIEVIGISFTKIFAKRHPPREGVD